MDSLDVVPAMQGLGGEQRSSLLNQIEDPSSRLVSLEDPTLCWLQDALKTLEPQQRCWLLARYVDNISIKDLALRERVSPGLLRQSIRTSLSLLRQAARAQQHGLQQHGLRLASKTQRQRDQHR